MLNPPKQILVVDDEPAILEAIQLILSNQGYCVSCAADGEGGLLLFEQKTWDAVITDRAMPGMSGEEMAEQMWRRRPEIPIIMISGNLHRLVRPERFQGLLAKPFSFVELGNLVKSVLRG